MNNDDDIFLCTDKQEILQTPEQIKYIHNAESADYINQFLLEQGELSISKANHESAPLLDQIRELDQDDEQHLNNKKTSQRKQKSLFHNFQKHLVITLKNIVRLSSDPQTQHQLIQKVASQMWTIFQKSHLYTKTILHILYGAEHEEQCAFTSSMLNKFGYVELFNKYNEDIVQKAQQYLRKETVKAMRKVNIKQYLSHRRLSKSEEFYEYLNQFIEELSEGPIKRRIPKNKKQNLKVYQKKHSLEKVQQTQVKNQPQNNDDQKQQKQEIVPQESVQNPKKMALKSETQDEKLKFHQLDAYQDLIK